MTWHNSYYKIVKLLTAKYVDIKNGLGRARSYAKRVQIDRINPERFQNLYLSDQLYVASWVLLDHGI